MAGEGFDQSDIDNLLQEAGLADDKTPEFGADAGSIDDILGEASAGAAGGESAGSSSFLNSSPAPAAEPAPGAAPAPAASGGGGGGGRAPSPAPAAFDASGATPASFESLDGGGAVTGMAADIEDLLGDVQLKVQVVLGRAAMTVDEILQLANGSVVELEKLAGDPLDILVNDRLVAKGEVLVLNENFCIRITDIIPPGER